MRCVETPLVIVFTGPSLRPDEAVQYLAADFQPPVAQGDIARAVKRAPHAIGIIDGYFEAVPSVWHKEILFAMSQGIHVFGSASMGALRATELAAFGMEGIGGVFTAFRDGLIEDDDEVAVIHGPAELGFPALSEAMVNIRRTLSDAFTQGIIGSHTRRRLEDSAKSLPYRERTYSRIIEAAQDLGVSPGDLDRLEAWLPQGRADQKKEDAIAMLQTIAERMHGGLEAKSVQYHFEHTVLWERVANAAQA